MDDSDAFDICRCILTCEMSNVENFDWWKVCHSNFKVGTIPMYRVIEEEKIQILLNTMMEF